MNQFDEKIFYNYNNYNFTKKNLTINLNSLQYKIFILQF